jgi:flagellar biosynthesis protein FlhA
MSGDFVIGLVVFAILITVNFLVITKGATRIAEVGARFTLAAIPGKQMAIDADLSAGLIDDKEAQHRRRELEEESAFFGSMDGASKFVRGEAIASLITIAVNIFGGIIIGVTRHGMPLSQAADVFTKLSVGDGLVSQIPALIVSLSAGLLVSKGGTRGTAEQAILGQLGAYPRALFVAAGLMLIFAIMPGLPFVPFAVLSIAMGTVAYLIPQRIAARHAAATSVANAEEQKRLTDARDRDAVKDSLKTSEIELRLGKHLAVQMLSAHGELGHRVAKMRRKFAKQYGFIVPDIKLVEAATAPPKSYQICIHGTVMASQPLRTGETMIVVGNGPLPSMPGEEFREPAFGMKAVWISDAYAVEARREGFSPVDGPSAMLTHLSEIIRGNLAQLLSYKDMRMLLDRLDPEYRRLIDDICPSHISYSGLQAVLKLLLAERVSIRNLNLILEAIAEIAPHSRRSEQVAEHVRMRIAQQICGDLAEDGVLSVLRLGNRWDVSFHQALKRDAKGEVVELDIDPRLVEQFGIEASEAIRERLKISHGFAIVTAPEVRSYVRMIIERLFPTIFVLSHVEIARGVEIRSLGAIS